MTDVKAFYVIYLYTPRVYDVHTGFPDFSGN